MTTTSRPPTSLLVSRPPCRLPPRVFDRLVTTAESHHRAIIMEVMGRDAGWIALHTAIAGGAEICLIPEIPYDAKVILRKIKKRYNKGRGFVNIVISEGAKPIGGGVVGKAAVSVGDKHIKTRRCGPTTFGRNWKNSVARHRSGRPSSAIPNGAVRPSLSTVSSPRQWASRLLNSLKMKTMEKWSLLSTTTWRQYPSKKAISEYNVLTLDNYLVNTARKLGVSFGDK